MKHLCDKQIIESWKKNVAPWVSAIENGEIASRLAITNQAILDAVTSRKPKTVLDIGCGEGWLVRELVNSGIDALGIDVIPEFIQYASEQGGGRFKTLAYENIATDSPGEQFDVVVSNFALLGRESVEHVFKQIPLLLNKGGAFIVQTIHPIAGCGDGIYKDGWREGSWAGFSDGFSDPAPWYFRTLETWKLLFRDNGLTLTNFQEPMNPHTRKAASILFIGEHIA